MNIYVLGGMALVIMILGWQLKASVTRNGELSTKLENQVLETQVAADANTTNMTTISQLRKKIETMIAQRKVDESVLRKVLDERSQELQAARAEADVLRDERDDDIFQNPDCGDLASLDVGFFCSVVGEQLRHRSTDQGSNPN